MCQTFSIRRQRDRLALTTILMPKTFSCNGNEKSHSGAIAFNPHHASRRRVKPSLAVPFPVAVGKNRTILLGTRPVTKRCVQFQFPSSYAEVKEGRCSVSNGADVSGGESCTSQVRNNVKVPESLDVTLAHRQSKAQHPAILKDAQRRESVLQYVNLVLDAQIDQWANGSKNPMCLAALAQDHSKHDAAEALYEGLQLHAEIRG